MRRRACTPDGAAAGGQGANVPRRARAPAGVSGFRAPTGVHARRAYTSGFRAPAGVHSPTRHDARWAVGVVSCWGVGSILYSFLKMVQVHQVVFFFL